MPAEWEQAENIPLLLLWSFFSKMVPSISALESHQINWNVAQIIYCNVDKQAVQLIKFTPYNSSFFLNGIKGMRFLSEWESSTQQLKR